MFKNEIVGLRQKILILCLFIAAALILQSCFGTSKHRGGSLGDAMEEASDDHEGDRTVDTYPDPEYDDDEADFVIGVAGPSTALVADDSLAADSAIVIQGPKSFWFSLAGGTGLLKEDVFFGLNHGNLALGAFFEERQYFEFTAGISWAPVQETNRLSESIDDGVILLQIGLGYKYYLTPRHTFMGLSFSAGLGYTYMRWSYKNPFEAMAYDEYGYALGMETISSDGLSGFEIYAGVGLNIVQTETVQLGLEVLPGLIAWGGETSEGFDNDVFDAFYYTKFKISLRFGF